VVPGCRPTILRRGQALRDDTRRGHGGVGYSVAALRLVREPAEIRAVSEENGNRQEGRGVRRTIIRAQGWLEASPSHLRALRDAIVSDQPEGVVAAEGSVRVHRLEPFPPKPEVERTNVSGELDVKPVGAVRRTR